MKKQNGIFLFVSLIFTILVVILTFNYQVDISKLYFDFLNNNSFNARSNLIVLFLKVIAIYAIFIGTYLVIKKLANKNNNEAGMTNLFFNKLENKLTLLFTFASIIIVSFYAKDIFSSYEVITSDIEKLYFSDLNSVDLTNFNHEENYLLQSNIFSFPTPLKIIEVDIDTLGNELPNTKDEGDIETIITINVDDKKITTFATIKVQGSSTARWPKKNWSIKLFKDENRLEELNIKIGDSIFSNKWILKADYIDPTMLRNGLSYTLWDQIVSSREDGFLEVRQSSIDNRGAQGCPKYFTVTTNINNSHYGITTLLLGHDPANFNIDNNNYQHLYFEFDARYGYTLEKTWDKFLASGIGTWIDFYNIKNGDINSMQAAAIDKPGEFLNSDISDFHSKFDLHLDRRNMIDMLLFYEMIYDWDGVAQDIEIVTYDLEKFYFLPWDKDTTFGMFWNGSGLINNSENQLLFNYENMQNSEKPWYKTYHTYTFEIEERYKFLRDNEVFSVSNFEEIVENIYSKIPNHLWELENYRWPNRPSTNDTSKEQILNWVELRLKLLDNHFNYID